MKRKIGLLIVTILSLVFIPNKVMAADWTNTLSCSSNGGFTPGSDVTCIYKVTPPSSNAANGVVGNVEISENLTITSITKGNSSYQGDIENTRFDFYSLSSDATPKTGIFDVVKINIKLGNVESGNEYVKIKDISVTDKDFNEVSLEEIETKIEIKNQSKDTESNNENKNDGKMDSSDNQGNSSDASSNTSSVKNPKTADIKIVLVTLGILVATVFIVIGYREVKKKNN